MEELEMRCGKCDYKFTGLGDDYYCPLCNKLFCFSHIDDHGCDVELDAPEHITGKWKVKRIE